MKEPSTDDLLFDVETPFGFSVRTTVRFWAIITTVKHPIMDGRQADVEQTLRQPKEVRISKSDERVYLFYRSDDVRRWLCAVVKRLNGSGFLVTAYRTGNIKEGKSIWPV